MKNRELEMFVLGIIIGGLLVISLYTLMNVDSYERDGAVRARTGEYYIDEFNQKKFRYLTEHE